MGRRRNAGAKGFAAGLGRRHGGGKRKPKRGGGEAAQVDEAVADAQGHHLARPTLRPALHVPCSCGLVSCGTPFTWNCGSEAKAAVLFSFFFDRELCGIPVG